MNDNSNYQEREKEFEEKVIRISRVSKKTKGGSKMGFSILMVIGDRKGRVGMGLGKAHDVLTAIKKGIRQAKKKLITVPIDGTTIPFSIRVKQGAGEVLLKPALRGSGVIAGGPVRAVVEAAGIRDISAKILGSDNQCSSVVATFAALTKMSKIVKVRKINLKSKLVEEQRQEEVAKQARLKAQPKADRPVKPAANKIATPKVGSKPVTVAKSAAKKAAIKPTPVKSGANPKKS